MNKKITDKNIKIAVIGYGRFGSLLTELLLEHTRADILVVSKKQITRRHSRLSRVPMKKIAEADIVFPCVAISDFTSVLQQIAPLVKNDALVIDVCSVKTGPVKNMKELMPKSAQIIATHPMFGPDSYGIQKSLKGLRIVVWNVRATKEIYNNLKVFFHKLGLVVIELSPEKHDMLMAKSLGYSYLIGKIGQKMGIRKTDIDTYDFGLLLEHVAIVKSDSEQLFLDMQTRNPFANKVYLEMKRTLDAIIGDIDKYIPKQN